METNQGFLESLKRRVLLGDGAMGTQLYEAGLEPDGCAEMWNLEYPERVLAVQKAYVDAGSDCLLTNTFGASSIRLERHGLAHETEAINCAGVQIARQAFGSRAGYVLGDIGPFGGLIEPFGDVGPDRVRFAFRQQATALVRAGVDAIIIETQSSLEELRIGIEAAREAGVPCLIGSLAFGLTLNGSEVRTMTDAEPEQAAEWLQKLGADVAAANCGKGIDMKWMVRILDRYRGACDLPLMAQPNAGSPELDGRRLVYRESPETMTSGVEDLLQVGARVVGACCGSTPAHIRSFRKVLDEWNQAVDSRKPDRHNL